MQLLLTNAFALLFYKAGDAIQFDWSLDILIIDSVEEKIKAAHFRLSHSHSYPRETQ